MSIRKSGQRPTFLAAFEWSFSVKEFWLVLGGDVLDHDRAVPELVNQVSLALDVRPRNGREFVALLAEDKMVRMLANMRVCRENIQSTSAISFQRCGAQS
jgi:hypothetical protein